MSRSQQYPSQQQPESRMNPEYPSSSLSASKNFSKSMTKTPPGQLYEQLKVNCEAMRIQAQVHLKHAENIWKIEPSELEQYFMNSYKELPYSRIRTQQLFEAERSKISRSQNKCYFGQIQHKKKEGQGIAIYKNGKIYQGTFRNNQKSGFGVEIYDNGNLYIGEFSQNKKHGKGSFFWFSLCESTAKGELVEQYHGDWWGGLPDGYGEHHKNNGDFYIGKFKNGLKHGDGVEMYINGQKYKGQFINGLPEGYGEYNWNDGSMYKGDFKQGSRNGYGIWKGGAEMKEIYKGHYMIDRKHGYGVYDWGNGYVYKGFFVQDLRYGQGEMLYNDEVEYKGYWENGEKVDEKPLQYPAKQVHETTHTSIKDSGIRNNSQERLTGSRFNSRGKTATTRKNYSADKRNRSRDQFSMSFKKQQTSQQKRVGHRNCIPCQTIGKMPPKQSHWRP